MPRSDTWPGGVAMETQGGITMETLGGMDSAGSCDSVVSLRSGFSDSSLEQLSAEERECILFLEETIDSLEADEECSLPRDEPDLHPPTGSLAEKIAHLSASISSSPSQHPHVGPKDERGKECKSVPGFLVPTPLVMAKNCQAGTEVGVGSPPTVSGKIGSSPGPNAVTAHRKEGCQVHPRASASRGPLSNQGLLELRSKPPLKKHAQSFSAGEKPKPSPISEGSQSHRPSDSSSQHALLHQTPKPKATPPVVAPKPKKLPPSIAVGTREAAVPSPDPKTHCLGASPRGGRVMDPQRVRREALTKLGLLQDGGPVIAPPVARTLPPAMTRPRSRSDLHLVSHATGGRSVVPERSGASLDLCPASKPRLRARTTSLRDRKEFEAGQPGATASEHLSHKPLFPNGISAAMAPWNQPGQVRQEALRKLGLLRE